MTLGKERKKGTKRKWKSKRRDRERIIVADRGEKEEGETLILID